MIDGAAVQRRYADGQSDVKGVLRRQPLLSAVLKRATDIVGASVLAVAFLPVVLVVTVSLIREGGPVVFAHERIGKAGRKIKVYKFRSMIPNAQQVLEGLLRTDPALKAEWEVDHKLRNDPRITPIGKFLRSTSLDEIPQLWNVFRGDMSLVGPRPIVEAEMEKYGRALRYYLVCKPGITGLWQVSGRNDTDYGRRVALDRQYAEKAGLMLDLAILVRTVLVVLRRSGAY